MKNTCLYCYQKLNEQELSTPAGAKGFHIRCSKKFFNRNVPPDFDFTEEQIPELAEFIIKGQKTVPGVQPKLSLGIFNKNELTERFTIVGLNGEYILKPPSTLYPNLPENEDLTMHLANLSRLQTVEHSLIRLQSGSLAYITKRIDRKNGEKRHMEDMCQLTERLTEHKYKGSYEQIAKALRRHTSNPGYNVSTFFELVLFCFLTGNNDMHLKNFSIIHLDNEYNLCPAYDLLASELVVVGDDEELALTLNGKKKNLKKIDFIKAMNSSGMDDKVIGNIFNKYAKLPPLWNGLIDKSFLPDRMKTDYKSLIQKKLNQLEL